MALTDSIRPNDTVVVDGTLIVRFVGYEAAGNRAIVDLGMDKGYKHDVSLSRITRLEE